MDQGSLQHAHSFWSAVKLANRTASYFFIKFTNKYERKTTRKAPATSNHLLAFGFSATSHSCHSN